MIHHLTMKRDLDDILFHVGNICGYKASERDYCSRALHGVQVVEVDVSGRYTNVAGTLTMIVVDRVDLLDGKVHTLLLKVSSTLRRFLLLCRRRCSLVGVRIVIAGLLCIRRRAELGAAPGSSTVFQNGKMFAGLARA